MPFRTYAETRPWAKAIRQAVVTRKMPPWFADPAYGHFANDPLAFEKRNPNAGRLGGRGRSGRRSERCPAASRLAGRLEHRNSRRGLRNARSRSRFPPPAPIEYQYVILPTRFAADKWIERVEVRPSNRATVHHAVVYIREPGSKWLAGEPTGATFSLPSTAGHRANPQSLTTSDILMVYTPGNSYEDWTAGHRKENRSRLRPRAADALHRNRQGRPPIAPASESCSRKRRPSKRC